MPILEGVVAELFGVVLISGFISLFVSRNERLASRRARRMLAWHVENALDHYFTSSTKSRLDVWMHELDVIMMTNAFALSASQQLALNNLRTSLKMIHVDGHYREWRPDIFMDRFRDFTNALKIGRRRRDKSAIDLELAIQHHLTLVAQGRIEGVNPAQFA